MFLTKFGMSKLMNRLATKAAKELVGT